METQKVKARELAARGRCVQNQDGSWTVYSLTSPAKYKVVLDVASPDKLDPKHTCTCPHFQTVRANCKHIRACIGVRLENLHDAENGLPPREREPDGPPRQYQRQTYQQPDWAKYNAGQCQERDLVQQLLADLCRTIPEPAPKGGRKGGRPPLPVATRVYAAVYKVYVGLSARRGTCDLEECQRRGHIGQAPHFNSVLNALEDESLTAVLYEMIRVSAMPLRAVESTFAVDSTGFCTNTYTRYLDVKYGTLKSEQQFVKLHAAVGTRTNVICAALILDKTAGDAPQLPHLMGETAKGFTVRECSADTAYASVENYDTVNSLGGRLYTTFNARTTGGVGGLFEKAYLAFRLHKDEYLAHYHRRSNVESTFSALKRKIGEAVKSKGEVAQRNEVLAKCLAYNLTVLAGEMHQTGLAVEFAPDACTKTDEPAQILSFPGR